MLTCSRTSLELESWGDSEREQVRGQNRRVELNVVDQDRRGDWFWIKFSRKFHRANSINPDDPEPSLCSSDVDPFLSFPFLCYLPHANPRFSLPFRIYGVMSSGGFVFPRMACEQGFVNMEAVLTLVSRRLDEFVRDEGASPIGDPTKVPLIFYGVSQGAILGAGYTEFSSLVRH